MDTPNKFRDDLRTLALELIDERRPAHELRNQVLEMKKFFEDASGRPFTPTNDDLGAGETRTPSGVAISPAMAAMCVDDFARTIQFIRGLNAAILDAGRKIGGRRAVRVLYAGCGPWATLATPLMTLFSPAEVSFTLVDLHSESLECVRVLTDTLGVSDRIHDIVTADLAGYRVDDTAAPDIVLIEMLRAALESEPQVEVARNLFRQAPEAIFLPQEIRIDLVLVNQSREFNYGDMSETSRDRAEVGPVFVLNASTLSTSQISSPVEITVPEFDEARYKPMLLTTVQVYGHHYLRDYDSGITLPKSLPHHVKVIAGNRLSFEYEVGTHPRLVVRALEG